MEIGNVRDLENCYVCSEYMGPFKNELTVVTGYSEKPIGLLIEMFTDEKISEEVLEVAGICQNCFIKFNEYDEHQTIADQMQLELTELYKREPIDYSEVKVEPEEYFFHFEDDNVEVVDMPDEVVLIPQQISPPEGFMKMEKEEKFMKPLIVKPVRKICEGRVDRDEGLTIVMIDGVKHYKCEFCGKDDFTSRSRIKTHRQIHTSERKYICQECGANFKTVNCLKNHSRLHSNIFYFCDVCPSKFKGKHELRCHMDAIHLGKKDHICQICGKAFSRDKTLRQHLMYHMNERNIACTICGFKTVNRPKMTRHMKSHTGERNYECHICNKRFLYSYNVTAHIKHVHYHEKRPVTNEEKLICSVCGKKFQKIWKVKEHMAQIHNIVEAEVEDVTKIELHI